MLGYRISAVDRALAARDDELSRAAEELTEAHDLIAMRDGEIRARDTELTTRWRRMEELDRVVRHLARAVVERDHELLELRSQFDEIGAQARGQATRIRMQALRQAAQLAGEGGSNGNGAGGGAGEVRANGIGALNTFEGTVHMDVGPLRDFSQLVSFEDAVTGIGAASEISVKRFSNGRATLALRLERPIELLRELEQRAPFEITVRSLRDDRLIVDVDEAA